jgi:DNA-binding NarL/FixJ family response regulator
MISQPLSPQQLAVFRLLADGRSVKQIAAELGITDRTIESHIQAARRKLGGGNAMSIVVLAVRRGWI